MDSGKNEIGQCAAGEGDAMEESESYPASSRSLDSLDEMRLVALLADMIEQQGKPGAAETLGVSVRTLGRFEESRRLTRTVAAALEAHLLRGGGSAADRQLSMTRNIRPVKGEIYRVFRPADLQGL